MVCRPVKLRGLGVLKLLTMNLAHLTKWVSMIMRTEGASNTIGVSTFMIRISFISQLLSYMRALDRWVDKKVNFFGGLQVEGR